MNSRRFAPDEPRPSDEEITRTLSLPVPSSVELARLLSAYQRRGLINWLPGFNWEIRHDD